MPSCTAQQYWWWWSSTMTQLEKKSASSAAAAAAMLAGAVGARTARACDGCAKRRARWYCAADDAFLCQSCDSSVHSANTLARRHERVRLKTSSSSSSILKSLFTDGEAAGAPAWQRGVKRKARTPRGSAKSGAPRSGPLVPDLETTSLDDQSAMIDDDEEPDQLLYQVPIFDPVLSELICSPPCAALENHHEGRVTINASASTLVGELEKVVVIPAGVHLLSTADQNFATPVDQENILPVFMPSDHMDFDEFAIDMETLLGQELDQVESFSLEKLGLVVDQARDGAGILIEGGLSSSSSLITRSQLPERIGGRVKEEESWEDGGSLAGGMDLTTFEFNFECNSPQLSGGDEDHLQEEKVKVAPVEGECGEGKMMMKKKRRVMLRLDYEAVVNAWPASQGSPWLDGQRPQLDADEYGWPHVDTGRLAPWGDGCEMGVAPWGDGCEMGVAVGAGGGGGHAGLPSSRGDVGREARVSRYREKRRTRLFSKKIRYEVRKLNAEKRPRMKGRFVKRTSASATAGAVNNRGGAVVPTTTRVF